MSESDVQGMYNGAVEVQGRLCKKAHGQPEENGKAADTPGAATDEICGDSHGAADRDAPKKAGQHPSRAFAEIPMGQRHQAPGQGHGTGGQDAVLGGPNGNRWFAERL